MMIYYFHFFPKITLIINKSTTGIAGKIEQLGYDNGYYDCHNIYLTNFENIVFVRTSNL